MVLSFLRDQAAPHTTLGADGDGRKDRPAGAGT